MTGMARRATAWALIAATAMLPAIVVAADLEVAPQPKSTPQAAPASAGPYAPPDATCIEWTDGCRTCQRSPAGEINCSNVGLACVQQASRCTRR